MKSTNSIKLLIAMMLFMVSTAFAQNATSTDAKPKTVAIMKTFLIERDIPDAAKLTGEQLKTISKKSCTVLKEMGPQIQWINSYVAGNKIYCIYKSESEELIREHAKKGGFPANTITEVSSVISPATAN